MSGPGNDDEYDHNWEVATHAAMRDAMAALTTTVHDGAGVNLGALLDGLLSHGPGEDDAAFYLRVRWTMMYLAGFGAAFLSALAKARTGVTDIELLERFAVGVAQVLPEPE